MTTDLKDRRESEESRKQYRSGPIAALNRSFDRMSLFRATAILTGVAVIIAVLLIIVLYLIDFLPWDPRTLDAAAIIALLTATPIILYAQLVIRQLKSSRQALRLMTERLAWAVHTAEHANDAKTHFLAHISHELRTPLNAIIGFSDIMRNQLIGPMLNSRYLDYAKDINESGTHLLSIINDILDLAKIEAGQVTMDDEREFDVAAAVEMACTMVRPQAARQRIELKIDVPDFRVALVGVERMVRQILVNILSNAVKFTSEGGLVGLVTELRANGNLIISVTDTGIGMSSEDIKVALTPFGQVNSELSRQHAGTGLGLPLAKAMMDLHGGRLVVRSEPGEGTTVALVFPAARIRGDRRARRREIAKAS